VIELEGANYQVTKQIVPTQGIDRDCEALVIVRPEVDWLPFEREALAAYLAEGGRVFLLMEPGLAPELAAELQRRAQAALEERDRQYDERRRELGVEDELAALDGLTPAMLVTLGEAGIKTLDDFADLASDELIDREDGVLRDFDLGEDEANALIMAARAHWFEDADDGEEGAPASATTNDGQAADTGEQAGIEAGTEA